MKRKKVLVLVPHPDDELLVAGSLIYTLRKKYNIYVVFSTNGDSINNSGDIRIREAIESLRVLGISEDRIEFLGYGNNWTGNKHIYNLPDEQYAVSAGGKEETYCIDSHMEYCLYREGKHHKYTRYNMKIDLKSLILEKKSDIIISVDLDSHPDHRALSLLFEEVMGEILKEDSNYKPIVLKKFAYAGMYNGVWDYYTKPCQETAPSYKIDLWDIRYELDNPTYSWKDRLQLFIDYKTRTRYIHSNVLYKAAKKHKSQNIVKHVGQFANADMVYWQRRTDGISYSAKVFATSGNASCVNDFKMVDSTNILENQEKFELLQKGVWMPEIDDSEKKLTFEFLHPVKVSKFLIYENYLTGENILKAVIRFDSGKEIFIDNIDHMGKKTEIVLEQQKNVKRVEFQILQYEGNKFGLTELEIYENDNEQIVPLKLYKSINKKSVSIENNIDILFERSMYHIVPNHDRECKFGVLYYLLLKWNEAGKDKICQWIRKHNYKNVAIYGMGDIGKLLSKELIFNGIEVLFAIDRMADTKSDIFPVITLDSLKEMPKVDIIINTIVTEHDQIAFNLISSGYDSDDIYSLEQIIKDVL